MEYNNQSIIRRMIGEYCGLTREQITRNKMICLVELMENKISGIVGSDIITDDEYNIEEMLDKMCEKYDLTRHYICGCDHAGICYHK